MMADSQEPENSPPPSTSSGKGTAQQPALNRSCEACRHAKTRCIPSSPEAEDAAGQRGPNPKCQRCEKTNRACIYMPHSTRRRKRGTDVRVAELEKRVQALGALLSTSGTEDKILENLIAKSDAPALHDPEQDVVARGLITMEQAGQLVSLYSDSLYPMHPGVTLPAGSTAATLRHSRPILFLAVLAAASLAAPFTTTDQCVRLNREVQVQYARRILLDGEKSLELVQGVLLSLIWSSPPDRHEQLKYHQFINVACTMAIDIGLTHRSAHQFFVIEHAPADSSTFHPRKPKTFDPKEGREAFLLCYICSSAIAISHRYPNSMHITPWLNENVSHIENDPNASLAEVKLCAWVRLLQMTQDYLTRLGADANALDPDSVDVTDHRTQVIVKAFDAQAARWRSELPAGVMNASLELCYRSCAVAVHELVLLTEVYPSDFAPPFRISIHPRKDRPRTRTLTWAHPDSIASLDSCVQHSRAALDVYLSQDMDAIRSMPIMNYVRSIHLLIAQIQVFLSGRRSETLSKGIIDVTESSIDYYHTRMISLMNTAGEGGRFRPSSKFGGALMILRAWIHSAIQAGSRSRQPTIQPLGASVTEEVNRMSISSASSAPTLGSSGTAQTATSGFVPSLSRDTSADSPATSPQNPNNGSGDTTSASPSNFGGGSFAMEDFPMEMELMGVDANLLAHLEDVGAIDMDMGSWNLGAEFSNVSGSIGGGNPAGNPASGGGSGVLKPPMPGQVMLPPNVGQTLDPTTWRTQF